MSRIFSWLASWFATPTSVCNAEAPRPFSEFATEDEDSAKAELVEAAVTTGDASFDLPHDGDARDPHSTTARLDGNPLPYDEAREYLASAFRAVKDAVDSDIPLVWRGDVTDEEAEILIFEGVSEVVGFGAMDGQSVYRGYILNLDEIYNTFCADDPEGGIDFCCVVKYLGCGGPEILVTGLWRDKSITIRFTASPLCDEKPSWCIHQDGKVTQKKESTDD